MHGPLIDPSREIIDRSQVRGRVESEQALFKQREDCGLGFDTERRQRVAHARERPDRSLGQREKAQSLARSEAQPGQNIGDVTNGIKLSGQIGSQGAGSNRISFKVT